MHVLVTLYTVHLMLFDLKTGSVKGVAVKSEWISDMTNSAKLKLGDGLDSGGVTKKDGVSFNEHLVFLLVLPIRFANLKAVDVGTVSHVWLTLSTFVIMEMCTKFAINRSCQHTMSEICFAKPCVRARILHCPRTRFCQRTGKSARPQVTCQSSHSNITVA